MGNELSKGAEAVQKPCGLECQTQKQIDKAYAAYVALAKDPEADPVELQKAKEQYDLLKRGHAAVFHEQVQQDATRMNQTGRPSGGGSQAFLQELLERLAALERQLEQLDADADRISAQTREVELEIARGQVMVNTMRRALELRQTL